MGKSAEGKVQSAVLPDRQTLFLHQCEIAEHRRSPRPVEQHADRGVGAVAGHHVQHAVAVQVRGGESHGVGADREGHRLQKAAMAVAAQHERHRPHGAGHVLAAIAVEAAEGHAARRRLAVGDDHIASRRAAAGPPRARPPLTRR